MGHGGGMLAMMARGRPDGGEGATYLGGDEGRETPTGDEAHGGGDDGGEEGARCGEWTEVNWGS